ncbi:MAG: 50S ribosomal protein L4, partial [Candidatus Wildermuthbacteria bacterium]|nr:50S ribosomal protein L4 [Candidatus Wildermuthbacteria bacterium]
VIDQLNLEKPKTKLIDKVLKNLAKTGTLVLVMPGTDKHIEQSARNLPYAKVLSAKSLNILDILNNKYLFLMQEAVPVIKDFYKIK